MQYVGEGQWLNSNTALFADTDIGILYRFQMSQSVILLLIFSNHLKIYITNGPYKHRQQARLRLLAFVHPVPRFSYERLLCRSPWVFIINGERRWEKLNLPCAKD